MYFTHAFDSNHKINKRVKIKKKPFFMRKKPQIWFRTFAFYKTPIIVIMGSYNARHIYPIGYSRRCCGATAVLIRESQTHPHNEEPEIRNRILWEGVRFLACRRKPECQEKTRRAWNRQTKFTYNYWQATLVNDQVFEHLTNPPCHRDSVNPNI